MQLIPSSTTRVVPAKVDLFNPTFFELPTEPPVGAAKHFGVGHLESMLVDSYIRLDMTLETCHLVFLSNYQMVEPAL